MAAGSPDSPGSVPDNHTVTRFAAAASGSRR
jgi:hypothetical protein